MEIRRIHNSRQTPATNDAVNIYSVSVDGWNSVGHECTVEHRYGTAGWLIAKALSAWTSISILLCNNGYWQFNRGVVTHLADPRRGALPADHRPGTSLRSRFAPVAPAGDQCAECGGTPGMPFRWTPASGGGV